MTNTSKPTNKESAKPERNKRKPMYPQIWLKGRKLEDFRKAMHFTAEIIEYAAEIEQVDLDGVLPHLDKDQLDSVRQAVFQINAVHDLIAARI